MRINRKNFKSLSANGEYRQVADFLFLSLQSNKRFSSVEYLQPGPRAPVPEKLSAQVGPERFLDRFEPARRNSVNESARPGAKLPRFKTLAGAPVGWTHLRAWSRPTA